jgi:hypothetical protein
MTTRPLLFLGNPTKEQTELVRQAKEELDPGFFVKPTRPTDETIGMALAFQWPDHPYIYGFLYVEHVKTVGQMKSVLRALWQGAYPDKVITPEKWFERMGWKVHEVEEEVDEAEGAHQVGG